jgi:hypothetical protein
LWKGGRGSLRVDEGAKLSEPPLAYAAHEHEMFRATEWAEALAVLDDARGERGADAGQFFQLLSRSSVEGDLRGAFSGRGILSRDHLRAAWQFDAGNEGGRRRAAQDDTAERLL